MSAQWYVLHVYSGFEKSVAESIQKACARKPNLADQIEEVLVPMEEVIEMKKGAKVNSERKFFPGYVLVKMEMTDEAWHLVKSQSPSVTFQIGESVRVCDGPFTSFNGLVEDVDGEKARLKVAVSIFGRSTPVELEYSQVEKS